MLRNSGETRGIEVNTKIVAKSGGYNPYSSTVFAQWVFPKYVWWVRCGILWYTIEYMKKTEKRNLKILEYNVIFYEEDDGWYSASVPDLPGCHSQGETLKAAQENIKEAIELYLEDANEELYHQTPDMNRRQIISRVQIQI